MESTITHSNLTKYIKAWNSVSGDKPVNDLYFTENFIQYLKEDDIFREVKFDGDGSYGGKQISISYDTRNYTNHDFEVAYDYNKSIRVYTGNHNGFWTQEYIRMDNDHPMFLELQNALLEFLYKTFGLPNSNH